MLFTVSEIVLKSFILYSSVNNTLAPIIIQLFGAFFMAIQI